jgi:hypothetical protein
MLDERYRPPRPETDGTDAAPVEVESEAMGSAAGS